MNYPLPANENARLAALNELALLDTPNELAFDRVTRLVTILLNVPNAAVTLIDANRQWFKSQVGLDISETPRDIAFCAHTIVKAAPLIVHDARLDARFAQNPFVTQANGLRFYVGIPLTNSQGLVLGSLCALDNSPRALSDEELGMLQVLADILIDEIHLRERLIEEQQSKETSQRALNALHLSLEQQIEQRTRELRLVIETAYDAYISTDINGLVVDWNHAAEAMFGWARKEALTRPLNQLIFPDDLPPMHETAPLCYRAMRKDGSLLPVEIRSKAFEVDGQPRRSLFIHDITERQQLELLRDQQAREDVLTQLPNRRALDERLPEAIARVYRSLKPLSVLFMDLDGFKRVNDSYGHAMGDELLREIAKRLSNSLRETDYIARWAGDEFVILLENTTLDVIEPLAQQVIGLVEQPVIVGDISLQVSASIGLALFSPHTAETAQELLKRADVAMYDAKRAGKAQVRLAQPAGTAPDR